MIKKVYRHDENEFGMNFLVYHPEKCENLPMIVYLHGAGERGTALEHLYRHGIAKMMNNGLELPAVVLCPQCPTWAVWDNVVDKVKSLIDFVAAEFAVDTSRITLTGSSMGGYGTFSMGLTYPNFFAGIAPVSGGGMSWRAVRLRNTPVLAVHGEKDNLVPFVCSQLMVENLRNGGGNVELIALKNFGHNDGIDFAYRSTKLISWLLAQKRTDFDHVPDVCEDCF